VEQLFIEKPVKTAGEQLCARRVNERSIKGANSAERPFVRGLLLPSGSYIKQTQQSHCYFWRRSLDGVARHLLPTRTFSCVGYWRIKRFLSNEFD
jgi:hypothetical protein